METTTSFTLALVGDITQRPYDGTFKVKTLLTRKEQFVADQYRRDLLGPNPEAAMPALVGEAFMISQLKVRVLEAPQWYSDSQFGLDLVDSNITAEIFEKVMAEAEKRREELKAKASVAKMEIK